MKQYDKVNCHLEVYGGYVFEEVRDGDMWDFNDV